MWPSLELCDSFLPFPPRPVFLVKESRARLPLEPFGAAQLPPPCRPGPEAAVGPEQSHIGGSTFLHGYCHLLHPSLWCGCRRVWAAQVGRGAEALAATTACGMAATEVKRGAATGCRVGLLSKHGIIMIL